jgi:hypothetical protein
MARDPNTTGARRPRGTPNLMWILMAAAVVILAALLLWWLLRDDDAVDDPITQPNGGVVDGTDDGLVDDTTPEGDDALVDDATPAPEGEGGAFDPRFVRTLASSGVFLTVSRG